MQEPHLLELCDAKNTILLVIDLQGKLYEMAFNSDQLGELVPKVMRLADLFTVPIVMTEQYPKGLGHTAPAIKAVYDELATDKHLLEKSFFGCCGEPGFNELVRELTSGVRDRATGWSDPDRPVEIVVLGIETHVCVQQTVLELLKRGYRVVVLEDCTGCRSEASHRIAIERFRQSGAIISSYESVAFEWARTKDNERFKQMSTIIKG